MATCMGCGRELGEVREGPVFKCGNCNRFVKWATPSEDGKDVPYFLAICDDEPDHPKGLTFSVYFVNNSQKDLSSVKLGFFEIQSGETATDGYASGLTEHKWKDVKAGTYILIDKDNEIGFDYTGCFDIGIVDEDGVVCNFRFMRGKMFWGKDIVPVLNKKGDIKLP